MTSHEIKKGIDLREAGAEKPPENLEQRLPNILEIRQELDIKTRDGLEAGHDTLATLTEQEQADVEYPPELKAQFAEIQKEAADKLRHLNLSLGQIEERFLLIANFLTGGLFEKEQRRPKEKNKFFTGFYRDRNGEGIKPQERGKMESQIDMAQIRERAIDASEYLSDKIRGSDVVLLGEIHTHETIEKRAVAGFLEKAKEAGITHVGLEIPAYYQEAVNHYMSTGKFDEADDPDDYEQVDEYHRLYREQLAQPEQSKQAYEFQKDEAGRYQAIKPKEMTDEFFAFERKMRKNYLFKNHFDKDFHLLQEVRESGLIPVCIDANATYGASKELDDGLESIGRGEMTVDKLEGLEQELEQRRDKFMLKKIQEVVKGGGKILAVLGNAHVAQEGKEGRKNVADLLGETEMKIASINIDRDCDSDAELSFFRREQKNSSETSANSVLFSAIENDKNLANRSIGFDLDQNITGGKTQAPYDGYIKLNSLNI